MRIAVLRGPHDFVVADEPVPAVGPEEVLVRVRACGVCASELDVWNGTAPGQYPRHLGHEVSGTVVQTGPGVTDVAAGDPVGVWGTARGYAEYVAVRAEHCRPAGDVPLDTALAEPLACAANAVERADVRLGDDVVILGAGFMGNLVQQLVRLRGARSVLVADTRQDALDRATALGATCVVRVGAESLVAAVHELTAGRGADVTFECTGTQPALQTLGDVTRMSGKLVLVGFHQGADREIPLAHWNWMAFDIVNAHFRDLPTILRGMTVGMRLLAEGSVSLVPLVTHRFALEDIGAAFSALQDKPPGFAKAAVVFDEPAPTA